MQCKLYNELGKGARLLEAAEDGGDAVGHHLDEVHAQQLGHEVGAREHLAGGAVGVVVEAQNVHDPARPVLLRVLAQRLLHMS